uniref:Uncharacterized protein n=1 Tax=Amphilophus citrinellus TaxID=61819 RepID=A0A3Q0QS79_AMPCI
MCVCPLTRAALHVFPLERLTALYRAAAAERTKQDSESTCSSSTHLIRGGLTYSRTATGLVPPEADVKHWSNQTLRVKLGFKLFLACIISKA